MAKVSPKITQKPHEFSDEELKRLAGYMDVLIQMDMQQKSLYRRLEQEPKGFSMPSEGRSCGLCGRHIWDEGGWFDRWGLNA